ncbi:MAG: hypothetical protein JW734_04940 [Candidatus Omnitrophica bacterium]|nr:hypothetical protein [Candidatus Omnitrophota bacterium]
MKEKEFCVTDGNINYAGFHLILEEWKARYFHYLFKIKDDLSVIIQTCREIFLNPAHPNKLILRPAENSFYFLRFKNKYYNPYIQIALFKLKEYLKEIVQ